MILLGHSLKGHLPNRWKRVFAREVFRLYLSQSVSFLTYIAALFRRDCARWRRKVGRCVTARSLKRMTAIQSVYLHRSAAFFLLLNFVPSVDFPIRFDFLEGLVRRSRHGAWTICTFLCRNTGASATDVQLSPKE